MKHQITLARTAGFCFGVDRAVKLVYRLIEEQEPVVTLGPIIHNPQLVSDLAEKGCIAIDDPIHAQGKTLVIRSHGIGKETYRLLEEHHIKYKDATCPFVTKIHRIVEKNSAAGKTVIIIGDANHPEVRGIIGHCQGTVFTAQNVDDLKNLKKEFTNQNKNDIIVVAQTTINLEIWKQCCAFIEKHCTNAEIFDTICNATNERQSEAIKLAKNSDLMLIIGGKHSSNTVKLLEVCRDFCPSALIETADELKTIDLHRYQRISVTAGASTPAYIIKEVLKSLKHCNLIPHP